jgi:hypothetical protein
VASPKLNPTSFRLPGFNLETPDGRANAHRLTTQGIVDLNQAIAALKTQVSSNAKAGATTVTTVVSGGTAPSAPLQFPGLGSKNDQTGNVAYTTQTTDNGALLILSNAAPVAVTLNSAMTTPYFLFITNFGAGATTLTPTTGLVNGAASLSLPQNTSVLAVFDGTNWETSALVIPTAGAFSSLTVNGFSFFNRVIAMVSGLISANIETVAARLKMIVTGPGFNLGNAGGWSTSKVIEMPTPTVAQRGIFQGIGFDLEKHAVGDTAGIYGYTSSDGGIQGQSDEGVTGATFQALENPGYFHGTVSATTGIGDIQPALALTSGNPWTTDGAFLLNISKGTISGSLNNGTGPFVGLNSVGGVLTTGLFKAAVTGVTLPLTTAWGVCGAIAGSLKTADGYISTTINVTLGQISGVTPAFVTGYVSVAGNSYPERCLVTAVGAVAAGVQSITFNSRNPNTYGIIFQGGIAGQFISMDANLAFSGMRSSFYAFGSINGTEMIGGSNVAGVVVAFYYGFGSDQAASLSGGFHLYPGAEVVTNTTTGFSPILEQNNVVWTVADIVENPHYPLFGGRALFIVKTQNSPTDANNGSTGISNNYRGYGITSGFSGLQIINGNANGNYFAYGGKVGAPKAIDIRGAHDTTMTITDGPPPGGTLINLDNLGGSTPGTFHILNCGSALNFVLDFNAVKHQFETRAAIAYTGTTTTTSATAGAATALPATPAGYLSQEINGTAVKIPYYNV